MEPSFSAQCQNHLIQIVRGGQGGQGGPEEKCIDTKMENATTTIQLNRTKSVYLTFSTVKSFWKTISETENTFHPNEMHQVPSNT